MVDNPRNVVNMRELHTSQNSEKTSLMEMFYQCTDIRLEKDAFSRLLCSPCANALKFAYEFRKQSQLTHSMLVQKVPQRSAEPIEVGGSDMSPVKTEMVDVEYEISGPSERYDFEDESMPKTEVDQIEYYAREYLSGDDDDIEYTEEETRHGAENDEDREERKRRRRSDWRGYLCISYSCRKLFRSSKEMRNHLVANKGEKVELIFLWAPTLLGKFFTRHHYLHCDE